MQKWNLTWFYEIKFRPQMEIESREFWHGDRFVILLPFYHIEFLIIFGYSIGIQYSSSKKCTLIVKWNFKYENLTLSIHLGQGIEISLKNIFLTLRDNWFLLIVNHISIAGNSLTVSVKETLKFKVQAWSEHGWAKYRAGWGTVDS